MFNDIHDLKTNLKLHGMGKRFRAGHAKAEPVGDRMINAVRGAIWEAWQMGWDKNGSMYPAVPLLDQLTQSQPGTSEEAPGLFSAQRHVVKRRFHPFFEDTKEPEEPTEPELGS